MRSASFLSNAVHMYFFQNNVVPQFVNGMVCWHYHLQWICGYVHVPKQATVLKSSPTPRFNSFDCSLNRHEITVYCLDVRFIILWRSALLLEDNEVPTDNHWPNACDRRCLSHKVVSSTPCHERKLKSPGVTPGFMVGLVVPSSF